MWQYNGAFYHMTKNMLVKKMPQKLVKNNSKVKIFFRLFVPSKKNNQSWNPARILIL